MIGILNINKPAGWTSRDVVNRVQRLVRPAKAGHAGTLDPLATGVLVVCVGQATRLISYVQQMPKMYRATFLLGRSSPSDDVETEVSELMDAPRPTLEEIEAQLPQFAGAIEQLPPAYSALKVKGQRAYKLAREGQVVTLEPRQVEIYELEVVKYEYPELELKMRCGSGTYVRSVGRDLAESLGTAAVMSQLERTAIGGFDVEEGLDIESLSVEVIEEKLISPLAAVEHLPRLELSDSQVVELQHGRLIAVGETKLVSESLPNCSNTPSPNPSPVNGGGGLKRSAEEVLAGVNAGGELVALVREKRTGMLGAVCNFSL